MDAKRSLANYVGALGVPTPPANTDLPMITGLAQVGETLTADPGEWTGVPAPALSYRWLADGEPIEGAIGATLTLTEAQEGAVITVAVTATNGVRGVSRARVVSAATDSVAAAEEQEP